MRKKSVHADEYNLSAVIKLLEVYVHPEDKVLLLCQDEKKKKKERKMKRKSSLLETLE